MINEAQMMSLKPLSADTVECDRSRQQHTDYLRKDSLINIQLDTFSHASRIIAVFR